MNAIPLSFFKMMVYQEEETEAALELATSLADNLMDHFTEKGLLAKEIKVAEIVEMEDEDEEWDTSQEAHYTYYSQYHLHNTHQIEDFFIF